MGQLFSVQHTEHIGLVLGPGSSSVQLPGAVVELDDLRVMTRGHRIETQGDRLVQKGFEFDLLIAAHTRVRCAPGRVLVDEIIDDIGLEPFGEIPDIEGNPQFLAGPPRI